MKLPFSQELINKMTDEASFDFSPIPDISLRDKKTPTMIYLRLRSEIPPESLLKKSDYPISGFPRNLGVEDEEYGTVSVRPRIALTQRTNSDSEIHEAP